MEEIWFCAVKSMLFSLSCLILLFIPLQAWKKTAWAYGHVWSPSYSGPCRWLYHNKSNLYFIVISWLSYHHTYYLCQVAPSSKLGLHYLRKMATYVRTREGSFPMLGWPMWRHIACGKLQLPDDLAWLYFETFDLLQGHTAEERLEWAECLSQCSSKTELDQQRSKVS